MNRLEQIILATLDLAFDKGLANVSLQMIADKIGIRKASLFNHIKNKDDLIDKMYLFLRNQVKEESKQITLNYTKKVNEILYDAYINYYNICLNSKLNKFYKLIYSERAFNNKAKELVVEETNKMVMMTSLLFNKLEEFKLLKFKNLELSAIEYAFTIHNFIDYEIDVSSLEISPKYCVEEYINYFVEMNSYEK